MQNDQSTAQAGSGAPQVTGGGLRAWRMNWIDNSRYYPLMLLLPVLIFFLLWNIIPLLWMVGMSFYNYSLITGMPPRF
ncbi:MAG: hypothetical protein PVI94_28055, partial [Desulfobacterales bacterium]